MRAFTGFLCLKGWSGWLHFQVQNDTFSLCLTFPIEKSQLTFTIVCIILRIKIINVVCYLEYEVLC